MPVAGWTREHEEIHAVVTPKTATIDLYGGRDPAVVPAYSALDVACYLSLPPSTVRAWASGGSPYNTRRGPKRFQPVIQLDDDEGKRFSFRNLVEIYVLSAIRRQHGVKLPQVRSAVTFLRKRTRSDHPLAELHLQTDGIDLFVEEFEKIVNVSRGGQIELKPLVEAYLARVNRDPHGVVIRLFPFTRSSIADAPCSVSIDPRVQFGRPCIHGTGIPTSAIAERYKAGESIADLTDDFGRPVADIEEALRYELSPAAA